MHGARGSPVSQRGVTARLFLSVPRAVNASTHESRVCEAEDEVAFGEMSWEFPKSGAHCVHLYCVAFFMVVER